MKVIKLFIASMLLLSSFQTFAAGALRITTAADFSTPENKSKVIELTINENYLGSAISNQGFEKLTGADADKFTLAGNKLTFIAKAFEAGSDNTYRVKIKATVDV
ncbi:hypothetical protein BSPLISOX_2679, partial [uncultured Gammaproteobacteria bacterium]